MVAMTVGIAVVRSKTTTELLALAVNRVLPSAVTISPSGPDRGFTPLARAAQHCAPGNPPNNPFGPNPPGSVKGALRQPNLVNEGTTGPPLKLVVPEALTMGGMTGRQGLALSPAWATELAPLIVFTATLLTVSTTTTSRPMRSEV